MHRLDVVDVVNAAAGFVVAAVDVEGNFNQRLGLEDGAGVGRVGILDVVLQFRERDGHDERGGVALRRNVNGLPEVVDVLSLAIGDVELKGDLSPRAIGLEPELRGVATGGVPLRDAADGAVVRRDLLRGAVFPLQRLLAAAFVVGLQRLFRSAAVGWPIPGLCELRAVGVGLEVLENDGLETVGAAVIAAATLSTTANKPVANLIWRFMVWFVEEFLVGGDAELGRGNLRHRREDEHQERRSKGGRKIRRYFCLHFSAGHPELGPSDSSCKQHGSSWFLLPV